MQKRFNGSSPTIAASAFISEQAYVIGDVTIDEAASCWPFVCVRGDSAPVTIGRETNVQEFSMIHGATIGDRVTVGHNVTIDNATVGDDVLVGIGSVVLGDATIEPDCVVAAGCVVPAGRTISSGHVAMGIPAETAPISDDQRALIRRLSDHYVSLGASYRSTGRFE